MVEIIKKHIKRHKIRKMCKRIKSIGENVELDYSMMIFNPENLNIGSHVRFGSNIRLNCQGGLTIGSGTIFAHNIEIQTVNHNYDSIDLESIPYDTKVIARAVEIGENVWIGSNVTIIPGITIGEGAIISMGTNVTKDIPPLAVVGGNPSRILKYRDSVKYFELKEKDRIYLKIKNNLEK